MGWNYLSIPKLQWCSHWIFRIDKKNHSTFYWACYYLSVQGLKLMKKAPDSMSNQHIGRHGIDYLGRSLSSMKKDFNYLCHFSVEEWCKIYVHVFIFPKIICMKKGLSLVFFFQFSDHSHWILFFFNQINKSILVWLMISCTRDGKPPSKPMMTHDISQMHVSCIPRPKRVNDFPDILYLDWFGNL